ncbi:MAG: hypothetical protein ACR2HM_03745 [Acidimicrobiales bacterium]
MTGDFDPSRAFRVLNQHEVGYVVIGGLASEFLGAAIGTNDIDICYERTPENMNRLAAALSDLHARLRVVGVDEELPFILDGRTLAAGDSFTFVSDAGDLDILGTPSGTAGFRDLDADATSYDLGEGLIVRVVSLDDLIRMKEAASRPKDQTHLHILSALKDMTAGAQDPPNE